MRNLFAAMNIYLSIYFEGSCKKPFNGSVECLAALNRRSYSCFRQGFVLLKKERKEGHQRCSNFNCNSEGPVHPSQFSWKGLKGCSETVCWMTSESWVRNTICLHLTSVCPTSRAHTLEFWASWEPLEGVTERLLGQWEELGWGMFTRYLPSRT